MSVLHAHIYPTIYSLIYVYVQDETISKKWPRGSWPHNTDLAVRVLECGDISTQSGLGGWWWHKPRPPPILWPTLKTPPQKRIDPREKKSLNWMALTLLTHGGVVMRVFNPYLFWWIHVLPTSAAPYMGNGHKIASVFPSEVWCVGWPYLLKWGGLLSRTNPRLVQLGGGGGVFCLAKIICFRCHFTGPNLLPLVLVMDAARIKAYTLGRINHRCTNS